MKKATYVVCLGLFALVALTGCFNAEDLAPTFNADSVKAAVQGRWAVEKVNNSFCRDNSCDASTVGGDPQEYFEFKADSVFIVRINPAVSYNTHDAYKATYENGGVILLSNNSRIERFELVELKEKRMVLKSTFTGRDPAAVFTDTYYLFR